MELADATVLIYKNPEGTLDEPLSNLQLHRWTLTILDGDTHETGLNNIVQYAIKAIGGTTVGALSVSAAGLFTFDYAGSGAVELFVWTTG